MAKTNKTTQTKKLINEKFRVHPNRSLKGQELMIRFRNRTVQGKQTGVYNDNEQAERARKMSKVEIKREALENASHIKQLSNKLNPNPNVQTNRPIRQSR